ncbi:undecaprenyl-phosphate glucose phosphotransferase [Pseudomonas alcaligenes]|uniref:Undecaprenyl-phosphate glucose phosphotransferase n=1 Tax=Aquipseudomonas alcaligenes TaxID=43263 RepID=A0ABR7S224_AQUAC|nr:undecaprenyl-phosphate glucose phosphotransferase [Pseudomonas alcaligenes]MBC9251077.1 undecaprenyl-phosphate glucose phosphotransferase [Pseudomonas alcaligenes]
MRFYPSYQPTFAERYPVAMLAAMADFLVVVASGYLSHLWRFGRLAMDGRYTLALFLFALLVMLSLWMCGLYRTWRGKSFTRQLGSLYGGWLAAIGIALTLTSALKVSQVYSRQWFFMLLLLGGLGCTLSRFVVFQLLRALRSGGHNLKSVVLVEAGGQAAHQLNQHRTLQEYGYHVTQTLPFATGDDWLQALVASVEQQQAHEVWLCLPLTEGGAIKAVLYALRHHLVEVRFIPEWGDIPLLNHRVSSIAGLYSLDLSCSPMDGSARVVKRLEDLLLGTLISLLILPLCLLIGVAVKLSSPGPMLFKQYRTGINGQKFKVYKFRSMVVHQESPEQVTQAVKGDARITPLGAFLRRTSLDELPQFFNVLQGRMSIVGPRPHALAHNEYYKDLVESYMQRHKVKPGITGWAQVNGFRGETDTLDKMQKRVEHDLWYIDNWSLGLDLRIILGTVFKGFGGSNAY